MLNQQILTRLQAEAALELRKRQEAEQFQKDKPPYRPQGVLVDVFHSEEREILVAGPAGTGKTLAVCQKIDYLCRTYEHIRVLICRKRRVDMSESVLVTLEDDVYGPGHPRRSKNRYFTRAYWYKETGSVIVIAGLDQRRGDGSTKAMSAQYDLIYVVEGTEATESDIENLVTRLRNNKLPFQQMVTDCNPSSARHWLKARADQGHTTHYMSTHQDNPTLWDEEKKDWTEWGKEYMSRLETLTGFRRDRLLLGKWASAEGVVFEEFTDLNIREEEPDLFYPTELAADDGYVDPRVFLFIQIKPEYILVFDELVHTRHLAETCASEVIERYEEGWPVIDLEACKQEGIEHLLISDENENWYFRPGWPKPELCVGPSEAKELQMRMRQADIPYRSATHRITQGISAVRRLICDGTKTRRLVVHPRCVTFLDELMASYRYPPGGSSRRSSDKPLDEDNHTTDAVRYWTWKRARKFWLDEEFTSVNPIPIARLIRGTGTKKNWKKEEVEVEVEVTA